MMFQSKFTAFVSSLLLAGSVFAGQAVVICPDINDIKAAGLVNAEEILPNQHLTYNISNYNTEFSWGFFIAPVEAETLEEALETANTVLSTMNEQGIPQESDPMNIMCLYNTGNPHLMAMAVRNPITPGQLKNHFNKFH
ncbi:MAG: DUF4949 domain-containing protein [bacterium]|nr:DUF4949 domain-containing protein [bacterium]